MTPVRLCPSRRSLLLLLVPALAALFLCGTPDSSCTGVRLRARAHVSISRTGTSLVVLPESGQYAMETAQLIAQLRKITLPRGEEWKIMDKHGTVVFEGLPPPTSEGLASQDEQRPPPRRSSRGLPELDCGQLRQLLLLLDSLQAGMVHCVHNL